MAIGLDPAEHAANPVISGIPTAVPDHLLLAAWRKIVVGQTDCPVLALELSEACGPEATAVHGAIIAFLTALAYAGRRRLRVGYPGCPGMTRDERQLLDLLAAAQSGAQIEVDAHLRWLTRCDLRAAVSVATEALATMLTAQQLTVRHARTAAAPDRGCALCLCAAESPVAVAGSMI